MSMTTKTFETERAMLKSLNHSIETSKDAATDYRALRDEVFRTLSNAGVKGNQIALWAGVDPMVVSKALRKEPHD